jgi:hypothetical protein
LADDARPAFARDVGGSVSRTVVDHNDFGWSFCLRCDAIQRLSEQQFPVVCGHDY